MPRAKFYNHREWKRARAQAMHDHGWLCTRCGISLIGKGMAAHVHHRKPLASAPALRTEPLNLRPLCVGCHNATHAEMKRGVGCDENGMPLDPSHPWAIKT